jgi:shikimate dehydrogenase
MNTFIDGKTKLIFLIGNPVEQSISPLFHNAGLQACGINAVYVTLKIYETDFEDIINSLKKMELLGLIVTHPYKHKIIPAIDEIDNDAQIIDAVNTVCVVNRQTWKGYNTDWHGVLKTLEMNNIQKDWNTLVIGAGGAAGATVYGLQKFGITSITITNRTQSKAENIAQKFNLNVLSNSELAKHLKKYSLIINATSVHFDAFIDKYNDSTCYYDLKYHMKPLDTKTYIDGKEMLINGGAKSFKLWTGVDAPVDVMRSKLFVK